MKTLAALYILLLSLLAVDQQAHGQDNQLWLDYNLSIPLASTNKFIYGGDTGLRGFISNSDFNQVVIRPTASYHFNQVIHAGAGLAGFFTFNNDAANIFEFRMQEEVDIRWPDLSIVAFNYRVRFDQRFFHFQDLPNDRTGRVRYLAGLESDDIRLFGSKRPIYFEFFWEGFKTLGKFSVEDTFVNQDRLTFIFGHRISTYVRYEVNYINQRQRIDLGSTIDTTNNILRIRFFHRLRQTRD